MQSIEKSSAPFVADVALINFDGEPRALDIDIAERLRFDRPRKIRDLIERNLVELQRYGVCPAVGQTSGAQGGRPSTSYYLNEPQALLICIRSDAECAPDVREMIIRVFLAYRRGQLTSAPIPADLAEKIERVADLERELSQKMAAIEKLLPALSAQPDISDIVRREVETAIAADPRRAVLDFVSVRHLLDEAKAIQKGRRSLNRKVGYALRDLAAQDKGDVAAKCPHTGVWLFRRTFAKTYMADTGNKLVKDHNDAVMGQGVFKLVHSSPRGNSTSPI